MKPYSLYIHIPFCISKCAYCDFLSFTSDEETKQRYVDSLCYELQSYSLTQKQSIGTIFVGGGTPTSLSGAQLKQIFDCVFNYYHIIDDCEISIEINPKTLDKEKLEFLKNGPINRVSIGLQSVFDHHLQTLSRIHNYEDFLSTYQSIKACGISNINVDLMFGLPNQTFKEWAMTLEKIVALEPTHISAYGLIVEEHTPFYRMYHDGELQLPDEDEERRMYYFTESYLKERGIYQYEISNYAKAGYECQHNLSYWSDINYIGVGLGSSSYILGSRYKNTDDLEKYIENSSHIDIIREKTSKPSRDRRLEEVIFLGLRLNKGIKLSWLKKTFNDPLENIFSKPFKKYMDLGCFVIDDGYLKLTRKGIDISNQVFSEFLIDEEED